MGAGSSHAAQEHPPAPTHPPEHPPAQTGTAWHGTCQARLQPGMHGCKGGRGDGQCLGTGRGTPVCPPCSPTAPQTIGGVTWRGGRTETWGLRGPGRDRGHPSPSPLPGAAAVPAPLLRWAQPQSRRGSGSQLSPSPLLRWKRKKNPNVISVLWRQSLQPTGGEFLQKGEKIALVNIHQTQPKAAGALAELISGSNGSATGCRTDTAATQQTS